jgi:hypothetical protein
VKIEYTPKRFSDAHHEIIRRANVLGDQYQAQGYDLTLRQLYYQFVARGWLENTPQEYKRLGGILNEARLAGEFDWDYMVDRTRNLAGGDGQDWQPESFQEAVARSYTVQLWQGQPTRMEAWVEKEALAGVVSRAADRLRVPWFSCRGYVSQSELWSASQRLERYLDEPDVERVVVLHLGDHDPSGIDMTRDIRERLGIFFDGDAYWAARDRVEIRRIALNMDQVEQYNPPPNPAKLTDSRVGGYMRRFGDESWELDALEPQVLDDLISQEVEGELLGGAWNEREELQEQQREQLTLVSRHWAKVQEYVATL